MPFHQFAATLGAVILGDVLVVIFIWALWAGTKVEKSGRDLSEAPWRVLLAGMLAPLVGGVCIYFGVSVH